MSLIKIDIDGLEINYIKRGEGKAILILPGWGTTIDTYMPLINSISSYGEVYCLDMPGTGDSSKLNESWNIDCYVDFIIKFIYSLGIKELDLIGHSNGGRIIIKLMSRRNLKFKVGKIILIGSAGIVHKKAFLQKIKIKTYKACKKIASNKIIYKMFPGMITAVKKHFGSEDYKNATPLMRETLVKLVNEDLREYMPNISVPTLLLWGSEDNATPVADGRVMEKLIPDAGLVEIQNGSHFVFLEKVAYVNKIIYTFLKGVN